MECYKQIQAIIDREPQTIPLHHISARSPKDRTVMTIRSLIPDGTDPHGVRLRGTGRDVYIDDAYIYRLT